MLPIAARDAPAASGSARLRTEPGPGAASARSGGAMSRRLALRGAFPGCGGRGFARSPLGAAPRLFSRGIGRGGCRSPRPPRPIPAALAAPCPGQRAASGPASERGKGPQRAAAALPVGAGASPLPVARGLSGDLALGLEDDVRHLFAVVAFDGVLLLHLGDLGIAVAQIFEELCRVVADRL